MSASPAAGQRNLTPGGKTKTPSKTTQSSKPPSQPPTKTLTPQAKIPAKISQQKTPAKLGQSKSGIQPPQIKDVKKDVQSGASSAKPQVDKAQRRNSTSSDAADSDDTHSNDSASDSEPISKVTQCNDDLQEQAPEPISDSDNADNESDDAAQGVGDEAEDKVDDATEKGTDAEQDTDDDSTCRARKDSASGTMTGAKKATDKLNKAANKSFKGKKAFEDTGEQAQDGDADDTAARIKDRVSDVAENAKRTAGDAEDSAASEAKDSGVDLKDDTKDAAEEAASENSDEATEGAVTAKDAAGDVSQKATQITEASAVKGNDASKDAAQGVDDAADDAAESGKMDVLSSLPLDMSVLKGGRVTKDGLIQGPGGPVGRLIEGDKEDLEDYEVGDNAEILDEDGDLVGRCELLPEEIKRQMAAAKEKGDLPQVASDVLKQLPEAGDAAQAQDGAREELNLPGLEILDGYTCNVSGEIFSDDGDKIGEVTDGDSQDLMKATLNRRGEFVSEHGDVIGHARVHEEAADIYPQASHKAKNEVIEDQLPGVEALEGRELNDVGVIQDIHGNELGHVEEDGKLKQKLDSGEIQAKDLQINERGEVVDPSGTVLGKVNLAEGAAEKLKQSTSLDLRILEGRKLSKKSQVLSDDGDVIGELSEGEPSKCAGRKITGSGEIRSESGEVLGRVRLVPGEAAETATKQLLEELGEAEDQGPGTMIPDLDILEGLKVNKRKLILNEDGEPIGELTSGQIEKCIGKRANAKGEVLDSQNNIIGHVKTIPQQVAPEDAAGAPQGEDADQPENQTEPHEQEQGDKEADPQHEDRETQEQEAAEGKQEHEAHVQDDGEAEYHGDSAKEEEGNEELPPLSILEGYTCNKLGKILDDKKNVLGELLDGDAKKLCKMKATCDKDGQFWSKGQVIGRAKTVLREDSDSEPEPEFAGFENLVVGKDGWIVDDAQSRVGTLVEGDKKKLVGRACDEDGDILDRKGSAIGRAIRYIEPEEEEGPEPLNLSSLEGLPLTKTGFIIGEGGTPIGRLVEGKARSLAGKKCDSSGQLWNDSGKVIGRCELIPEDERESKSDGPFSGYEGLHVIAGGKVADKSENVVGRLIDGNAQRLVGMSIDSDGDCLDRYGSVQGHAEPMPDEQQIDFSVLDGKQLNKAGFVVDDDQSPIGKITEGSAKELAGRRCDSSGFLYNDTGKVCGRCIPLSEDERPTKEEGPFDGLGGLRVIKDGWVQDENGNTVGRVVEGNTKKLVGMSVDEDGDILDKLGNVKGHAEPYEEEDEESENLSSLNGCTVNRAGNVVDASGTIKGRVSDGDVKAMINRRVDGSGQIWNDAGRVVGHAELVHDLDNSPEGPFAGFTAITVSKDGTVITADRDVVGRLVEGEARKLRGHQVGEDGSITDRNGNEIGKAERWEPEEKDRQISPLSGRKINKDGEVRSEAGEVIGRLTMGDLGRCIGNEVDDNSNVIDGSGQKIGEATLLENIVEAEPEEQPEEEQDEMSEEEKQQQQDREVAKKMANICAQTLERVQPICKQIKEHLDTAESKPRDEVDQNQLVNDVKPLIEEGGRILQECNGSLRGLDPDGSIAARAKGRSGTGEASQEEHHLAECLKDLTNNVTATIDDAKKRLKNFPQARKKLNPLWGLLSQPLFQTLSAVGLLLTGVLGLLSQILTFGQFNLAKSILGGLGIDKLFGFGDKVVEKGKNALSSLPVVGGLLGGGK